MAESDQHLIEKVKAEYEKGDYESAMNLLIKDMKENPDNGTTHYYMGLIKNEMGEDLPALAELELAARLLPAETLSSFTNQAISSVKTGKRKLPEPPKHKEWYEAMADSVNQFFSGTPAKEGEGGSTQWQMPDMMAGFDDLYRQARRMVRNQDKKKKRKHGGYQSWAATTMSMADIQDLVRKSKVINPDKWASHRDGVQSFRQSPANTPAWDYWISRFTRSFQYILMSHLAKEGEIRPYGSVACIFSIDKSGNLRGHIYASTASARLNRCLIKTIRELNHSRILQFPRNAKITGYNFQMRWDFGKLLRYIAYVRAVKKKQAELLKLQEEEKARLIARKKAEAEILAREKAKKAKEKRLALLRKKAREAQTQYVRKADVAGQVLKPQELKARQLTLKDVPFNETSDTFNGDPFSTIDDRTIMSWPELNR